ncbi:retrovirus-related pol polyprotein from transposon TNT 1-94 [Tanacetum coccineum]
MANQHLTNSTKDLFNVSDISILNLTLGHPNGTLAKVSAIGCLRLTTNVVLFDVLVVPEYNVNLMSVHKLIKDSKLFVGFDETKCYIQDLNLVKTLGSGSKARGLYLFDVKQSGESIVGLSNSTFVCHASKQLWHNRLGHPADQVLSVLSPYKVVSRDGYKYFLTVVDDYSRAVWAYLVKSKDEVPFLVESFVELIYTQFNKRVKNFSSDNGNEFVNNRLGFPFYLVWSIPLLKKTEPKHPVVQISCPDKNALPSTEQLLLTLMEEVKGQSTSKPTPARINRMSKTFGECKYCGSIKHHPDDCEFYPGCEICGSIAHEIADCPKNLRNSRKQRDYLKRSVWYLDSGCSRHMTGVKQYLHRYSKESGPKVVFGDNSSGDTKGYGSVNCNGITFTKGTIFNEKDEVVLIAPRRRDVYVIDMSSYNTNSNACFYAKASPSVNWLWHKRLSHLNFKTINNLSKHNLVSGLPSLTFSKDKNCSTCEKGKHHRATFKTKRSFSINKCLHLLHMDLFGPVKPQTISHNKYTLVIVDEYSRYTWVFCLKKKSDAADCIMSFIRQMENLNDTKVKQLRSDNETEFRNHTLEAFCDEKGISQNFSSPCTPEQNGVAERRNRILIEAARTMLNSSFLPKQFWGEAANAACYTQNRSIIVKRHRKTAYEVFRGRAPNISYFHAFGCPVHIHNHRDHVGKFNEKADCWDS